MHRSGPQILDSGLSEIFMPVQAARLSASRVKYTDDDELEFLESLRQTALDRFPKKRFPVVGGEDDRDGGVCGGHHETWGRGLYHRSRSRS
jgi:hypothetical protein